MKQSVFKVISNIELKTDIWQMVLKGDTSPITAPGQFVNVRIEGRFLRRPISVNSVEGNKITLVYKVVGEGTEELSRIYPGRELDLITGLGNGFDVSQSGERPLLLGGGIGCAPLYELAKILIKEGKHVTVILGFNTANENYCEDAFKALGADVYVTTVDGSYGIKGFVTDALEGIKYTYTYSCGPIPMLKAVYLKVDWGEMSLEERMGCGFGVCMGCSCKTLVGTKRICKDGPVFKKEEIIWKTA